MKLMRTVKYTWQDYKTNEDIWSELKINPVVKNIQNFWINGHSVLGEWTEPACHTLIIIISAMWETKPRTTPQKTSRTLMGPEHVTRPKTLQAIWSWLRLWWWRWYNILGVCESDSQSGSQWKAPRLKKHLSIEHNMQRLCIIWEVQA
jgi:hypothetical protein